MEKHFNLKAVFGNKNVIICILIAVLVSTVGLTAYVGYNEYTYRKVGVCFTENNYKLAEYYIESISPSYKDAEKIKSLIHTVKNFDKTNPNDYSRTLAMLESYKGFDNVNVNYFYNSYYHKVLDLSKTYNLSQQSQVQQSIVENTTTNTTQSASDATNSDGIIVYYVESGEVYHINNACRSLSNASKVLSGPIPEGRRECKVCGEG